MLGYNKTFTRANINGLINIGPGAGGGRKRRGKKGDLSNTFDDYCWLDKMNCRVYKCISLAKRITWRQNSRGHFLRGLKFELFLCWLSCSQVDTSKKGKFYYFWHFGSFFYPWGIKYMAMQSCFYYNTIFNIVCLRLLDGGLSLDHYRCDRSIFDRCTFFFRHPSSCSGHPVAIITPCITQRPAFTEALTIFTFHRYFKTEDLPDDSPEMLGFTHLLTEPPCDKMTRSHLLLDTVNGFDRINLDFKRFPFFSLVLAPKICIQEKRGWKKSDKSRSWLFESYIAA